MTTIAELVDKTQTYYCLDCGVCTGSCPVSKINPAFSPRQIIERSLYELEDSSDDTIWSCLTCSQCSVRCPADIDFPSFVRMIRDKATQEGYKGVPSHNGVFQTVSAIQTMGAAQNRNFWIKDEKVAETGDVMYFVGCRPYHDIVFRDIEAGSLEAPRNVVKILNALDITPVVSNDERCCGHDSMWNGEMERFLSLARMNLETIKASGAKKVIFSCPEGYHTVKEVYPQYFGDLDFTPVHLLEFLAEKVKEGSVSFNAVADKVVTYHDPCRLGRLSGIYDAPRTIIDAIPGLTFNEMERSGENGVCCGTSGWMNCSNCSKQIQMARLKEASDTGASTVITACPKCQIHFKCTKSAFDLTIEITDLLDLVAESIKTD